MTKDEFQTAEPTHVHTVRLPHTLREALRALARKHQRSLHGEIVWALRDYVERQQSGTKES
jgi:predicted transcriptional regulator